jgi:hypothetical protein
MSERGWRTAIRCTDQRVGDHNMADILLRKREGGLDAGRKCVFTDLLLM